LPSDRAQLIEIISQGAGFRPPEIATAIELLDAALARAEGNTYEALVAVDDDGQRLTGYACFGATPMTDATYDLYWLVVAAGARGRGIGAELFAAVERELAGRRATLIRVETSSLEGQGGAARFYQKCGFKQVGAIPNFYRDGDDLLTFAKVL
jgi:ribosomal protein S18 acetylase RimI-like enzyme